MQAVPQPRSKPRSRKQHSRAAQRTGATGTTVATGVPTSNASSKSRAPTPTAKGTQGATKTNSKVEVAKLPATSVNKPATAGTVTPPNTELPNKTVTPPTVKRGALGSAAATGGHAKSQVAAKSKVAKADIEDEIQFADPTDSRSQATTVATTSAQATPDSPLSSVGLGDTPDVSGDCGEDSSNQWDLVIDADAARAAEAAERERAVALAQQRGLAAQSKRTPVALPLWGGPRARPEGSAASARPNLKGDSQHCEGAGGKGPIYSERPKMHPTTRGVLLSADAALMRGVVAPMDAAAGSFAKWADNQVDLLAKAEKRLQHKATAATMAAPQVIRSWFGYR